MIITGKTQMNDKLNKSSDRGDAMAIPRKTPVDYGKDFMKSGMLLITDPASDRYLRQATKKVAYIEKKPTDNA
tara:strand:- start:215 stop:433 length:219 start_codon:yes stop_codon:yes gene_type:complete